MTFLAPLWLAAAVLGAIVLLLHATRRREVAVPSLQLWFRLDAGSARRKIRRRPPITASLLLQLLAVLLAALALAQPRIGGVGADHFVFVIDGSGSMRTIDVDGESRFVAARADLLAAIRAVAADGDARVSVIRAGTVPTLVVARQNRPAGIIPLAEGIAPGDDIVDWPATLSAAASLLVDGETVDVTILTDDTSGATAAARALSAGASVATVGYGVPDAADAALSARLVPIDPTAGRWRIEGTIALTNGAPLPAEVEVFFAPGAEGGLLEWQPIAVRPPRVAADGDPNARQTVPFGGELNLPGAGRLRVSLSGDASPSNDATFFVIHGTPKPLRVVIVGPPAENLVRAIEAVGPAEISTAERVPADVRDIDLVVIATEVNERPATNILWVGAGRLAVDPAPVPRAASDPTWWNTVHPLSRHIDWAGLAGPPANRVGPLPGAGVILAAADAPLVEARTTASGREVRLALDLADGAFAADPAFPVFIANLVAWLAPDFGRDAAVSCIAGTPCPLAARDLAARVVSPGDALAWPGIRDAGPLPRGLDEAFVPLEAGFYTAARPDGAVSAIAVNAATNESTAATGSSGAVPETPLRLAPWLAAAAFLVLLAEAIIAGRGVERFLRRGALRAATPGSGRRRTILALRIAALAAVLAAAFAVPVPDRGPAETVLAIAPPAAGASVAAVTAFAAAAEERAGDGRLALLSATAMASPGVNLEGAIRLAAAMVPADRAGRIVIASDGHETVGAVGAAVPALVARGIALDVEPLAAMPSGEVLVGPVVAGAHVRAGDSAPLSALVHAETAGPAELSIFRDGRLVVTRNADLEAGWNRIDTILAGIDAPTLVEVAIAAEGDSEPGNNRNGVIVNPGAAPRILVLSPERAWADVFASALEAQGLAPELLAPDRAPRDLAGWLAWDVVVLMNLPALALTTAQQELLDTAVAEHGRGLVILGGENAFGPGGYYATPLERLSPLSSRVPQEAPRAAIVFVLDRSGSMQAPVDDLTRLDIAKAATLGAVELLAEETEVGIVVFDSEAQILVPMQRRRDAAAVGAALAPLAPGGGTELFPALSEALGLLRDSTAETKHIVVITDGLVEPVDFTALLDDIVTAGITVSTVAVGTSAITDKLERIALDGGGAYHATADFKALPGILAEEAMYLSTSPVMVGPRPVDRVDAAPFLENLPTALPPIEAFVATTAKPEAELHLATIDDAGVPMPLLASWRYGIGRVLAFATHGAGPGTIRWLGLPEYPLLWAQVVRAFLPDVAAPGLHVNLDGDGDVIRVEAVLIAENGEPAPSASLRATVDGGESVALSALADGRYLATFIATPGPHEVTVTDAAATASAAIHVGYPALLDFTAASGGNLSAAAILTGGTVVDAVAALATTDIWRLSPAFTPWLLLALVLLLADLALRQSPLRLRPRISVDTRAPDDIEIPGLRRAPR